MREACRKSQNGMQGHRFTRKNLKGAGRLWIGSFPSLGLVRQGFYQLTPLSDSASPQFLRWEEPRGKARLGRGCWEHADF